MRKIVERAFNRLGYDITPEWRRFSEPQTRYLRQLFSLLKPDCVIDVGANAGQYGRYLRDHVGYSGHIESFEPIPEVAAQARATAQGDAKWTIHEMALGRSVTTATFQVMEADQFSSFLDPKPDQPDAFDPTSNTVKRKIDVEVSTLDVMLPEMARRTGVSRVYLKLDTQGFDLEVVAGGQKSMHEFVGVQSEVAVRELYKGAPTFDQTIAAFRALGFEPSALFPTNDAFPYLVDLDLHLVRPAAVASAKA